MIEAAYTWSKDDAELDLVVRGTGEEVHEVWDDEADGRQWSDDEIAEIPEDVIEEMEIELARVECDQEPDWDSMRGGHDDI